MTATLVVPVVLTPPVPTPPVPEPPSTAGRPLFLPGRPRVRRLGAGPFPPSAATSPAVLPPPPEPVDPDDRRAITAAVRTALEVLDGRRPLAQLREVFDRTPLRYWRAEVGRYDAATPARLLRVRLCRPGAASVEVAATCAIGGRVRAMAARFERQGPGWRCTTVRLI